jgi:hypothetical protein
MQLFNILSFLLVTTCFGLSRPSNTQHTEHQHAKRRTGTTGASVETSREENGENGYITHKEYARRKKWTAPKEGTRLNNNKSFKDKKILENEILKTKLNKLFSKNSFSLCQRRNTVWPKNNYLIQCDSFSIDTNTRVWPTEAETCCEEEKG